MFLFRKDGVKLQNVLLNCNLTSSHLDTYLNWNTTTTHKVHSGLKKILVWRYHYSNSNVRPANSFKISFYCTALASSELLKKQIFKLFNILLPTQRNLEFSNTPQFLTFDTKFMCSYLFIIKLIAYTWYVLGKNIGPDLVRSGRTRPANLGVRSCPG